MQPKYKIGQTVYLPTGDGAVACTISSIKGFWGASDSQGSFLYSLTESSSVWERQLSLTYEEALLKTMHFMESRIKEAMDEHVEPLKEKYKAINLELNELAHKRGSSEANT